MLQICLCDHNSIVRNLYKKQIEALAKKYSLPTKVFSYSTSEHLIDAYLKNAQFPDVIYMDAGIKHMGGIKVATELRRLGCSAQLIFLASNEHYVFDVFDVSPLYFLTKDQTDAKKFESVFLKAVEKVNKEAENHFVCKRNFITKRIPYSEILYFTTAGQLVEIHFNDTRTFSFYTTLDKLSENLKEKGFIRIHRSFLINLACIQDVENRRITLRNGESLPLSNRYFNNINVTPQLLHCSIRA